MNDAVITIIVAIFAAMLGAFFGYVITNSSWTIDCRNASVHVTEGKVYDCEPRK